ncbi:protein TolR [Thermomonas sp.]|jgi:biopolymer transport protein TolR|uniref:protein TolR n=1 Tax=Thermomonas sp. TaxID=1971895 RepID=UPI001B58F3B3|nr:protein TolR [Thermomonas sp.]MBK6333563.1 protein TolR [Thermomonas sp.]MBK6416184.1 protein TolR [Thermomonas sp.]MBK6925337.1 protein TolR [Thermomonas sp.]MBK7205302.1 protein TolR [Thermomonas sp.]MBK9669502.1 protein TolR [Thermomonas sp.]
MALTSASRRHRRKKLKAEINVVPYIDVMLVLLIIFMVTAPLLNVGVDVNLPQADARPLEQKNTKPVVVQVASDGSLALTYEGLDRPQRVDRVQLVAKVKGFVDADPQLPVYVAGDRDASYQTVYEILTLLQREARVSRAGLMGNPADREGK